MEKGEVIGLEECQQKPAPGQPLPNRQHTVTCKANGSTVLFLSYQHFADRVLSDATSERDVIFENLVRKVFFNTRQKQNQRTIWNANYGRDAKFATEGQLLPEEVKRPKMQTASDFIQSKINTEYYNLISIGLHDREQLNLNLSNKLRQEEIERKNKELNDFFKIDLLMGLRTSI